MASIYLVEDHLILRDGLRVLLGNARHQVVGESGDVTQSLADLRRLDPEVILLDLHLGVRSGFEVLEELRQRDRAGRVVVLSMSIRVRDVVEAVKAGVGGYVRKGAAYEDLLHAVDVVARGGRYLSEELSAIAASGLAADRTGPKALSPRERQILVMVVRGRTSAAIGEQLHLSAKTVETYRSRLMLKLGLDSVSSLVRWAVREQLIELDG